MKTGIELIAEERERQITQEGWTPEHDDSHEEGELASAASCYARYAGITSALKAQGMPNSARRLSPMEFWPWDRSWWKPQGNVRDLVKAGALIAAEIDRLQRAAQ